MGAGQSLEVVHVRPTRSRSPILIVLQHFDVKLVQPPGGTDINRIVLDLLDGGDPGQWKEEAEMVREVIELFGDDLTAGQILGFQSLPISG